MLAASAALSVSAQAQKTDGGKPAAPSPGAEASETGHFRVYVAGFKVNRETADDPLQRDGVRDEVAVSGASFTVNAEGRATSVLGPGWFSAIMGDEGRNNVQRAGSGGDRGGLQTGDSHPAHGRFTEPLIRGHLLFNGTLMRGRNAVVFAPMLLEWDNNNLEILESFGRAWRAAMPRMAERVSQALHASGAAAEREDVRLGRLGETFGPFGSGRPGAFGDLGPRTRPIGMQRVRDEFVFRPDVLVLTFESADRASRANMGFGLGVIPVNAVDEDAMRGNYTIMVRVERVR
jgi:hypothetical protein